MRSYNVDILRKIFSTNVSYALFNILRLRINWMYESILSVLVET